MGSAYIRPQQQTGMSTQLIAWATLLLLLCGLHTAVVECAVESADPPVLENFMCTPDYDVNDCIPITECPQSCPSTHHSHDTAYCVNKGENGTEYGAQHICCRITRDCKQDYVPSPPAQPPAPLFPPSSPNPPQPPPPPPSVKTYLNFSTPTILMTVGGMGVTLMALGACLRRISRQHEINLEMQRQVEKQAEDHFEVLKKRYIAAQLSVGSERNKESWADGDDKPVVDCFKSYLSDPDWDGSLVADLEMNQILVPTSPGARSRGAAVPVFGSTPQPTPAAASLRDPAVPLSPGPPPYVLAPPGGASFSREENAAASFVTRPSKLSRLGSKSTSAKARSPSPGKLRGELSSPSMPMLERQSPARHKSPAGRTRALSPAAQRTLSPAATIARSRAPSAGPGSAMATAAAVESPMRRRPTEDAESWRTALPPVPTELATPRPGQDLPETSKPWWQSLSFTPRGSARNTPRGSARHTPRGVSPPRHL